MSADLLRAAAQKLRAELPAWAAPKAFAVQTNSECTDGVAFCGFDHELPDWVGVACEDCEVIDIHHPVLAQVIVSLLNARVYMGRLLADLAVALYDEDEPFAAEAIHVARAVLGEEEGDDAR